MPAYVSAITLFPLAGGNPLGINYDNRADFLVKKRENTSLDGSTMLALPRQTELYFAPTDQLVPAQIEWLTTKLFDKRMFGKHWWGDPSLDLKTSALPLDIKWPWKKHIQDFDHHGGGLGLAVTLANGSVEGAMLLADASYPLDFGTQKQSLCVYLLATAPHNRPELRKDGRPYFQGVGISLLIAAIEQSNSLGLDGRLHLFSLPHAVDWYERHGFIACGGFIPSSGLQYVPMELPAKAAQALLWRDPGSGGK